MMRRGLICARSPMWIDASLTEDQIVDRNLIVSGRDQIQTDAVNRQDP